MKRSSVLAAAGLFVALAGAAGGLALYKSQELAGGHGGGGFEPAEAVNIAEARTVQWNPTSDLVGTVIAVRSVLVRNELAGVVTTVGFESGGVVEEGRVLLAQDDAT